MKKVLLIFLFLFQYGTVCSCSATQIKLGAKIGLAASLLTGFTISWQNYNDTSSLIEVQDPEFNKVCQKIIKILGIKEKVQFKFHKGKLSENVLGFYPFHSTLFTNKIIPGSKTVYINRDYYNKNKSMTIHTIVHELEHHRQVNKYPGSYHGNNEKLMETGADAAAAGFFDCIECLQSNMSKASFNDKGYFNQKDYECYLTRLKEKTTYCNGCKKNNSWLGNNEAAWSDYLSLYS